MGDTFRVTVIIITLVTQWRQTLTLNLNSLSDVSNDPSIYCFDCVGWEAAYQQHDRVRGHEKPSSLNNAASGW